jgi:hypothetical protein
VTGNQQIGSMRVLVLKKGCCCRFVWFKAIKGLLLHLKPLVGSGSLKYHMQKSVPHLSKAERQGCNEGLRAEFMTGAYNTRHAE